MSFFHVIEDGRCVLRSKGVYRQTKVYRRGEDVYAALGLGFVKLGTGGGTTLPNVSWLEIEAEGVTLSNVRRPVWSGDAEPAGQGAIAA